MSVSVNVAGMLHVRMSGCVCFVVYWYVYVCVYSYMHTCSCTSSEQSILPNCLNPYPEHHRFLKASRKTLCTLNQICWAMSSA